jgi:hypothetical protein
MRAPSLKKLIFELEISEGQARSIRKLAASVERRAALQHLIETEHMTTEQFFRRIVSDPYESRAGRRTVMMHAINRILAFHGVEGFGKLSEDPREGYPLEYCNPGDQYMPTIVYLRRQDRLLISEYEKFHQLIKES